MDFSQRTIDLAHRNVDEGGRPFATVIVDDGEVLAESPNRVAQTHDPTAHAEILAIREACAKLGTEHLTRSTIYVLAQPCPMCLGALYYCSPREVVFLTTRESYPRTTSTTGSTSSSTPSTTSSPSRGTSGAYPCASTSATRPSTCTGGGRSATAVSATSCRSPCPE